MPDLGPNNGPNSIMSKNFPDWCLSFPIFSSTFVDFMKNGSKIPKLQMHENLHKNVFIHNFMQFFMSFYGGQLKQQICYSFTLLISYMVFNPVLVFPI